MQYVVNQADQLQGLRPNQALDALSGLLGLDRNSLVFYLPELEGYRTGNVNINPLEGGNFHVVGDLAEQEPIQYFSPLRAQFYTDRDQAVEREHQHSPHVSPSIVELPRQINVVLEKQPEEQAVYFVRDNIQLAPESEAQHQELPVGIIRAVIKRPPETEEMVSTYDNYLQQIDGAPDSAQHEQGLFYALDGLSNYHPHRLAKSPLNSSVKRYFVSFPELHGYQPAHLQQMSKALKSRNPLYLRNNSLGKRRIIGQNIRVQDVIRIALWVAAGVLLGVLIGIYFT